MTHSKLFFESLTAPNLQTFDLGYHNPAKNARSKLKICKISYIPCWLIAGKYFILFHVKHYIIIILYVESFHGGLSPMTNFKRLTRSLNQMAAHTYNTLRWALILTSIMLLSALTFTVAGGFEANKIAQELISLGAVTLFFGTVAAAIVEETQKKRED